MKKEIKKTLEEKRQDLHNLKETEKRLEKLVNETIEELNALLLKKECYFAAMGNVKFQIAKLSKEVRDK